MRKYAKSGGPLIMISLSIKNLDTAWKGSFWLVIIEIDINKHISHWSDKITRKINLLANSSAELIIIYMIIIKRCLFSWAHMQ